MPKFHRSIIWTLTPLTGYFRYKDIFQIYPADFENMPKSKYQRHYPVILEFTYSDEDRISYQSEFEDFEKLAPDTPTHIIKEEQFARILTVLTNHLFFRYRGLTGGWGIPILKDDPGEEFNNSISKWNMKTFYYPGISNDLKGEIFATPNCPEITFLEHWDYFMHNPNLDFRLEEPIFFPNSIKASLDTYFVLSPEEKKVIDVSLSHIESAIENHRKNKVTISLISSFTSIETLVNYEFKDFKAEKCKCCGQLQFKVSQKYRDFLFKYIGKTDSNKRKFNAYYKLRSKIIHAGRIMETENLWNDLPKEEKHKESLTHLEVLQLSKIATIHWLLKKE
ncbi:MAG: HEPN domain-containing protein [Patescibacteria group bacterium]|jgi:hypothetical protein|nr:HEPN domain-containing protein [Patescibacteria group bacterium]